MDLNQAAAKIIRDNRYLSLGTAGPDGPWVSPIAYTVEPNLDLVFYSAVESVHSRNAVVSPRIAGAIFDSTAPSDTADGIQFAGTVEVVQSVDLSSVMKRYFLQSFPDAEVRERWLRAESDFEGDAPQRFYRIRIASLFCLDPSSAKVDRRLELDIEKVKSFYFSEGL